MLARNPSPPHTLPMHPALMCDALQDLADESLLDPDIADACDAVDVSALHARVAGSTANLVRLIDLLSVATPTAAYAVGWSPLHVAAWQPYVDAEMTAMQRRAMAMLAYRPVPGARNALRHTLHQTGVL